MKGPDKYGSDSSKRLFEVNEIFFDFEGTVVDFQWRLGPAVEECLTALDQAGFDRTWYGDNPGYTHIYNFTLKLAKDGKGNSDPSSARAIIDTIYDRYDADALSRWNLYLDTIDVLKTLRESGFRMGIVSNVGKVSLQAAMERLNLSGLVDVVISRNDVKRIKPHPEGLIRAAEELEVNTAQSIFIGDSRNDVSAAREAGMLAGYISGGEDAPEDMIRFPADLEIERLSQLPSFIAKITS